MTQCSKTHSQVGGDRNYGQCVECHHERQFHQETGCLICKRPQS